MANKSGSKSYYDLVNEAGKELNLFWQTKTNFYERSQGWLYH
jgi:hypothetical protein